MIRQGKNVPTEIKHLVRCLLGRNNLLDDTISKYWTQKGVKRPDNRDTRPHRQASLAAQRSVVGFIHPSEDVC